MNKTEYILRSLSRIRHKKWEYFVVSRIIHRIDDRDIEFVTQQQVRLPDGTWKLTDLFFPQFGIHLEVDEPPHLSRKREDLRREQDIILATSHRIERLKVLDEAEAEKSLDQICSEADEFAEKILREKEMMLASGEFLPWDLESRYLSAPVIERGYLDVADNVTFRVQVEALRCFGFQGNGWQKGAWKIPDKTNDWVWFPRLYSHHIWKNELTPDGQHIFQRAANEEARQHNARQNVQAAASEKRGKIIVFAKSKDALGANLLRYVGTFQHNIDASTDKAIQFDLVSTREKVRC